MNNLSKVTIMIPTYNQSKYLAQAIESALNQDYPNLEVVVSDDASTDDTVDIVSRYLSDPRLTYYKNEVNLGRVRNYRKTLVERANGKYVLNLDGDDWLVNNSYISKAVAILDDDEIAMVFGKQNSFVEETGTVIQALQRGAGLANVMDGNELFLKYYQISVPHLSTVFRRLDAVRIGCYTSDTIGSDSEAIKRLILGNKVGFINEVAGVWRLHSSNASGNQRAEQVLGNLEEIESSYRYALSRGIFTRRTLDSWRYGLLNARCSKYLYRYIRRGELAEAFRFFTLLSQRKPLIALSLMLDLRPLSKQVQHKLRAAPHSSNRSNVHG